MKSGWATTGLALAGLLAIAVPALASAASPPATAQSVQVAGKHQKRIDAIAEALGITPQQARTAIHDGAIAYLAQVSHLSTTEVQQRLQSLRHKGHIAPGRVGLRAVAVGLKAVASQLKMTPQQLRQAIRDRSLQLPAGTTVQALDSVAATAVQQWLQGIAAKHPKLTAARQQQIAQRAGAIINRLLTRATTPAQGAPAPSSD